MRPVRGAAWVLALVLLACSNGQASAAWCNVFQVCWHKQRCNTSNYYAASPVYVAQASPAACCNPCPQQCTTRYVQRCYYQPVTSYVSKSYYEPVTTYQTSYYYEPVKSYRYSCYYDPCTCSYQQVASPTVSYQLRQQCCPVQSWVQRCCSVPVTNYQQSFYWEPVTSCCTPTSMVQANPAPCATDQTAPAPLATAPGAGVNEQRAINPMTPGVNETQAPGAAGAPGTGGGSQYDRYYSPPTPGLQQTPPPPISGSSNRQPAPLPQGYTPPRVRLDSIVSTPKAHVEGLILRGSQVPAAGETITFVSMDRQGSRLALRADQQGMFRTTLSSGAWLVYLDDVQGRPILHSKMELRDHENQRVTLVKR